MTTTGPGPRGAALLAGLAVITAVSAVASPARAEEERHAGLEAVRELLDDERYYDAFAKLTEMIPQLSIDDPARVVAQFELARLLYDLKLYQSALRAFDAVIVPRDSRVYREKLRYYLAIQRALPGDLATIERISEAPEEMHRREDLDEIRFLLGRYYYDTGVHDRALAQLSRIGPTGREHYLKARLLMGIVHVARNDAQPALDAFKDVLRYEMQVGNPEYFAPYKEMALMSLGRLFYSTGQFDTAGRYYDQMPEGTSAWLDSLFELGWTYFRLGRIDRVLGQLHTLNSPYFEDRYYPEARVLEALILFRTCRFDETLVVVQRFLRDYKPLRKELDMQLSGSRSDAEFYEYLATLARDREQLSVPLRRIFNAALNDKRLSRLFVIVVRANEEKEGLEKLVRNTTAREAAQALLEDLGRARNVMISEAGSMARRRLSRMREDLTEVIRQGLRIKYETLKARRNSITASVREDMWQTAQAVSEPREPDPEHVVWPFDGSYWRDELGGYTYDIKSRCTEEYFPANRRRGGGPADATPPPNAPKAKKGKSKTRR